MATAKDIANYILILSDEPDVGELISNLKLQKLVYYCQAFYLAMTGKPLFEEDIEAWAHGPVIPSIYHEFKKYGSNAIPIPKKFDESVLSEDEKEIINEVYEVYGQYSAWRLRNLTHNEPPYNNAIGNKISKKKLKEYFSEFIADDTDG